MLPKIVAIIGPTASGKSALGFQLANEFCGEIISGDAKQVYKGMDLGTAKEKSQKIVQHLLDIKDPGEKITVVEYQALAYEVINTLLARSILPIIVGGSGLYVESVVNGYQFGEGEKSRVQQPLYQVLKIGIDIDRATLKQRAAARLSERIENGLVDEVKGLIAAGVSKEWLKSCGLEYKYITEHLLGERDLKSAIGMIEIATNQYIKRQYTWWRRHSDIFWVRDFDEAERLVTRF